MLYEDVNDITDWLSEPSRDREGHYLGPPAPPAMHRWVDAEYLRPVSDDEILDGFTQALGL